MERVTIRQLRNDVSRVVRRARSGERMIVTVDGVPAAQIGPLDGPTAPRSLDDLIALGMIVPARTRARAKPARPVRFSGERTSDEIIRGHRDRA